MLKPDKKILLLDVKYEIMNATENQGGNTRETVHCSSAVGHQGVPTLALHIEPKVGKFCITVYPSSHPPLFLPICRVRKGANIYTHIVHKLSVYKGRGATSSLPLCFLHAVNILMIIVMIAIINYNCFNLLTRFSSDQALFRDDEVRLLLLITIVLTC
jgi:hypothetical protein